MRKICFLFRMVVEIRIMIWIEPSVADLIPEIQRIELGMSSIDDIRNLKVG